MVYKTRDKYEEAYEEIRQNSLSSNNSCIIFVAQDVDALCACKILVGLLKADFITHKIVPVSGYVDLTVANQELIENNDELRSIILLNCGALVDLSELLDLGPEMTVYVFDSHRPYNLHNCFGNEQVVMLDDGDIEEIKEERLAFEMLEFGDDEDEGSGNESENNESRSEDDDEDREDGDRNDRPKQRRRTGVDTEIAASNKRMEKRIKKRENQRKIAEYYSSGTYYGMSVAGQLYTLASSLARTGNEYVWMALIGLTSQFIFEHIDRQKYYAAVEIFQDEVARFNIRSDSQDSGVDISSQSTAEDTQIKCEDEYRFVLFRHWSLYDSMYHSSYIASKLGIWREKGRSLLRHLYAKMGISREQYEQLYTHMNVDLKRSLPLKFEKVGPNYGLVELTYASFLRTFGFKGSLSASDAVYSLASMLECNPEVAARLGAKLDWVEHEEFGSIDENKDQNEEEKLLKREERGRTWRLRSFYTAYDALGNFELLMSGLQLYKSFQTAIVRQGTAMIEKQSVRTIKSFRLAVIKEGSDLPIFAHPLTLSKLCLFLVDAYREHGRRNLPFVIAAFNEASDSFLVVGMTGAPTFGDVRKNHFGLAFQDTASRSGARVKHDSFETSVLEVRKDDLELFIEQLHVRI